MKGCFRAITKIPLYTTNGAASPYFLSAVEFDDEIEFFVVKRTRDVESEFSDRAVYRDLMIKKVYNEDVYAITVNETELVPAQQDIINFSKIVYEALHQKG